MSSSAVSTRAAMSSSSRRGNIQLLSSLALGTTLLLLLSQSCGISEGSPRPRPLPLFPFPFTLGGSFNTSFAQQLAITKLQNKINILDVLIAKYPVNTVSSVNTVNTATVSTINTGR